MMRTSTLIGWARRAAGPPAARGSGAAWAGGRCATSPISSRKRVPPLAAANDAGERGVGAGEGALAIAEQLAFEHVRGTALQLNGTNGRSARLEARWIDAREHLLAGAGLAGQKHRQGARGEPGAPWSRARPTARTPTRCRIAVEGLDRPQRGALLLVAAIRTRARRWSPASGSAPACSDGRAGRGRTRSSHVSSLCTPTSMRSFGGRPWRPPGPRRRSSRDRRTADATRAPAAKGEGFGAVGLLQHRERLAPEDVWMPGELQQGDCRVEVTQGFWLNRRVSTDSAF